MTDKILIFQEVRDRFAGLVADLEKLDLEFFSFSEVGEVPKMVAELSPKVVLLRSLEIAKELRRTNAGARILLIGEDDSKDRAETAECDLVLIEPVTEVQLLEALLELVRSDGSPIEEGPAEETKRVATRVDFSGPVNYVFKGKQKQGWGVNASRTGMLFHTDEEIPSESILLIRFDLPNGKTFDLGASSIRSTKLEAPDREFTHAIGAKFLRLREAERDRLDMLMESRSLEAAQRLNPDYLQELIENGDDILVEAFQKEINPTGLAIYLKEVGPFERDAFSTTGEVQGIVRRLVALRVQCYAFRLFLPAIKANRARYTLTMIPLLKELIEHADKTESEVEKWVKDVGRQGDEKNRQELNESSNRLYQAKTKLLYAVDEILGPLKLGSEGEMVRKISERVKALQQLRSAPGDEVRYGRKPMSPQTRKETTRVGKPPVAIEETSNLPVVRILIMVALIVVIGWFIFIKKPGVEVVDLHAPVKLIEASVQNEALVIKVEWSLWKNLPKRTRDELMYSAEKIVRDRGLKQATVIDERDQPVAVLDAIETPTGLSFNRRYIQR